MLRWMLSRIRVVSSSSSSAGGGGGGGAGGFSFGRESPPLPFCFEWESRRWRWRSERDRDRDRRWRRDEPELKFFGEKSSIWLVEWTLTVNESVYCVDDCANENANDDYASVSTNDDRIGNEIVVDLDLDFDFVSMTDNRFSMTTTMAVNYFEQ